MKKSVAMRIKKLYVAVSVVIATLLLSSVFVAVVLNYLPPSMTMEPGSDKFKSINKFNGNGRDKNVVIVHGIGTHCMGYADGFISDLMNSIVLDDTESATNNFSSFYKDVSGCERYVGKNETAELSYNVMSLLSCECDLIHTGDIRSLNSPELLSKKGQPEYIQRISQYNVNESYATMDCFEISVPHTTERGDESYSTGFVRVIETPLSNGKKFRAFEITWSPAVRWAKVPLYRVQQQNRHRNWWTSWLNQAIKAEVVDSSIADAIAYLGDSGALIKYTMLQSLCIVLAKSNENHQEALPYSPKCTADQLAMATNFEQNNDVFFVTHSLGTRVLFDTLGLLSSGVASQQSNGEGGGAKTSRDNADSKLNKSEPHLVAEIMTGFEKLGVKFGSSSESLPNYASPEYTKLLDQSIKGLIRSIRSIFVFTNQIPLLYSEIGSPFRTDDSDFSKGLTNFLKIRRDGSFDTPLEVVSFSDSDDVLSYNLKCWYSLSILRENKLVKKEIYKFALKYGEAFDEAGSDSIEKICGDNRECKQGYQHYYVLKAVRKKGCFRENYDQEVPPFNNLYESMWSTQEDIKFFDVDVFMTGVRIPLLFAYPHHIHSNYFEYTEVADALVTGIN